MRIGAVWLTSPVVTAGEPEDDLRSLVADLLLLDAMAHTYGRQADRNAVYGLEDWWHNDGAAFVRLATVAHQRLTEHLREERFEAIVHDYIRTASKRAIRRHRRRHRYGVRPPIPTVALAYFRHHHTRPDRPQACHPWWMGELFNRHPDDLPPEIDPYLG